MSKILESAQKDPRKRSLDDDIRLMAGSMLTYSNLISTNEGTETQAVKMVVHKFRDKLLGCLMLPLAFTYFVLFSASIMLHEDIADVYLIESELRSNMDALFGEVEDIDTLWDTLMGPFSQSLFKQTDMYGRTLTRPAATATDKWGNWRQVGVYNQIQGAVRFQQTRRTAAGSGSAYTCGSEVTCFLCRANRGFQPAFLESAGAAPIDCGDWPNATRRLSDEQPMDVRTSEEGRRLSLMQPTTLSSLPKESNNEMSIFRFYIYPSEDLTRSMERMQYFRSRNWLDKDSQVLQIRLYLMNSELGQPNLEQMTLTFYFADGGSVYYSRDFQAIFFEVFPNSFSLVADGLFFLTLCFTGVLQTIVLWRALRDRRMKKYLTDIRNLLELIVIAGGIYFCAQFYMVYLTKEETTEFITNLRAKGWNIYDAQQEDVEELFAKGESASSEILSLRLLAANYTLILTFRFFANFQAQPQLAIITNTLGSLIVEIVHFMVVFIPAFLVYVFSATLLFGRRIEDVSTFWGSMGYIFRMTQEGEYDWEAFQMENYWSSAIWVWSFVVFINMLLINLLIAIILDTYKELQKAEESREAVWNTMAQFWYRLIYVRRWVSELDVAKLCSDRYRPELLDKITMQEQFPQMPPHQLDLIFEDSAIQMQAQANKDINTEKLVKMAGSLMSSVSGVNDSLAEMMTEESRDSLQSWVVGKTPGGKAEGDLQYKGSKPPRLVDPVKVDSVDSIPEGEEALSEKEELPDPDEAIPIEEEWKTLWLRETETMMKAQRSWLVNASWHLDQLNAVLKQRAKQLGVSGKVLPSKGTPAKVKEPAAFSTLRATS